MSMYVGCKLMVSPIKRLNMLCGLPTQLSGKESACQGRRFRRHRFNPWVRKIPWRRKWQPTPVFLPGESHGQRSLAAYSPWSQWVGHDLATEHANMLCRADGISSLSPSLWRMLNHRQSVLCIISVAVRDQLKRSSDMFSCMKHLPLFRCQSPAKPSSLITAHYSSSQKDFYQRKFEQTNVCRPWTVIFVSKSGHRITCSISCWVISSGFNM